jgi:hypothetical protein
MQWTRMPKKKEKMPQEKLLSQSLKSGLVLELAR